jgi:hypothetical protein
VQAFLFWRQRFVDCALGGPDAVRVARCFAGFRVAFDATDGPLPLGVDAQDHAILFSRYSIGHADEVLRALEGAQTGPAKIDDEEPEDIEKYRQKVKDGD